LVWFGRKIARKNLSLNGGSFQAVYNFPPFFRGGYKRRSFPSKRGEIISTICGARIVGNIPPQVGEKPFRGFFATTWGLPHLRRRFLNEPTILCPPFIEKKVVKETPQSLVLKRSRKNSSSCEGKERGIIPQK